MSIDTVLGLLGICREWMALFVKNKRSIFYVLAFFWATEALFSVETTSIQRCLFKVGDVLQKSCIDQEGSFPVTAITDYYLDESGELSPEQIASKEYADRFEAIQKSSYQFGYSGAHLWFRLKLNVPAGASMKDWGLVLLNPDIFYISAYFAGPGQDIFQVYNGGLMRNLEQDRGRLYYWVPLENAPKGESTLYIRTYSEWALMGSLSVMDRLTNSGADMHYSVAGLLMTGAVFVILLFNIFLYFQLKDSIYIYYCMFLSMGYIGQIPSLGLFPLFFDELDMNLVLNITRLGISLWVLFHFFFIREFLESRKYLPWVDKLILLSIAIWILVSSGFHWMQPHKVYLFFEVIGTFTLLVGIAGAVKRIQEGYSPAWIFLVANGAYMGIMIIFMLGSSNVIKIADITELYAYPLLAINIEGVLLALAMAYRFTVMRRENKRLQGMEKELEIAGEIQRYLFPAKSPEGPGYKMVAYYRPTSIISGDFYDFISYGEKGFRFLLCDVAGHGYSAGLIASMIKVAFHEAVARKESVEGQLEEINRILLSNIENVFVTAINGYFDLEQKVLHLAFCGHDPAFLQRRSKSGKIEPLKPKGMPLGVREKTGSEGIKIDLHPEDRFFFYTDGFIEMISERDFEFSQKYLRELFVAHSQKNVDEFATLLKEEVQKQPGSKNRADDVTFIVVDIF